MCWGVRWFCDIEICVVESGGNEDLLGRWVM